MTEIKADVVQAVEKELRYQSNKWGPDKEQSLPGYLLIMRKELEEAELAWCKNTHGIRQSCLEELVQVVAVGVRCLETYGVRGCAGSTNDITEAEMLNGRLEASEKRFGAK